MRTLLIISTHLSTTVELVWFIFSANPEDQNNLEQETPPQSAFTGKAWKEKMKGPLESGVKGAQERPK